MANQNLAATAAAKGVDREITSVEQCAELLIDHIKQLRQEQNIADEQEISIYVTDVPLVHSTLSTLGDRVKRATNAVDIVQVNIQAGNPMPENLPQREIHVFSKEPVTVAIDEA